MSKGWTIILKIVKLVNDNPVDIPIDKRVLNNDEGAGHHHYSVRKPSKYIEIVWKNKKVCLLNNIILAPQYKVIEY